MDRDYVIEKLPVNGRVLSYKQIEGAFCQPNAGMCVKMLEWALDVTTPANGTPDHDLLELYCGNGNFTIALAQNFDKCLATEISKASVAAARENCEANGVTNVELVRMSSEEFTDSLVNGTERFRLREMDLASYNFQTILVDPPRAGLDEATLQFSGTFARIVYISCNPATLARDLQVLCRTHEVQSFAVFDQFPYTPHTECGAYLVRK